MKRFLALFFVVIFMTGSLCACEVKGSVGKAAGNDSSDAKKLKIVTTIFPEYDWVKNLVGDVANAEITMLLDNGVDLHSYQPTVNDIVKITDCDLFIYVGGESDKWVDDVLKQSKNSNRKVIDLLEALGDAVKAEEIVEGMEHEHDHDEDEDHDHDGGHDEDGDHDHDDDYDEDDDHEGDHDEDGDHEGDHDHEDGDDHDHAHGHEEELDEHVWLSLRNASVLCGVITDALCELDEAHKDAYRANLESYQAKLTALDEKYKEAVKSATYKTLLFGDRFPFRYLTDDYGLSYYAAFTGCSAESEASFETITFLSGKLNELGLPAIMTIEGKNHKIAESIRSASNAKNQKILTLDSLQSTTSKDVAGGASYLKSMEENLETLKQALK